MVVEPELEPLANTISIFYRKDIGAQNIHLCRQLAIITHIYEYFSEAHWNLCYHYVDKYQQ